MKDPSQAFPQAAEAAAHFRMPGRLSRIEPVGGGHINDTYRLVFTRDGRLRRYILQRVNRRVFRDPVSQMENIERVLRHLKAKAEGARRALRLVPARDGSALWRDPAGETWRATAYIEGTRTLTVARTPAQAYQAARAFGRFQLLLSDLGGSRLRETLPHFHDTPRRVAAFRNALSEDRLGRARRVRREADCVLSHEPAAGVIEELKARGAIPERVVHNDTKIDNVLFDAATGEGLCVVDLDTVMTGVSLHDFGDLVRSAVSPAPEDETDLGKVALRMPVFEALARGYLEGAGAVLNGEERRLLAFSSRLIAFELGMRFLTDYLEGDVYFKIRRPGHNLDRCRSQLRLAELLSLGEVEMDRVVQGLERELSSGRARGRTRGCGG